MGVVLIRPARAGSGRFSSWPARFVSKYGRQSKVADATTPPRRLCLYSMKNSVHRNTIAGLVGQRLAALGASNIPTSARQVIEDDVWLSVAALIQRRISAPVVGRAVARALAAPAATEQGREGGTPSPSSAVAQSAQGRVAGRTPLPATAQPGHTSGGPDQLPQGVSA